MRFSPPRYHHPLLPHLVSDVGCKTVANMIKGKTPEEIRKLFNIVNDFTPEEEVRSISLCSLFMLLIHRSRTL